MTTAKCVADRLLEICQQRDLAINALANDAGLSPSTVKNIINGASQNPGIVTLKKICDGLGITLVDFFSTEDFQNLEQEIR